MQDPSQAFANDPEDVAAFFGTKLEGNEKGLTPAQVTANRGKYGENKFPPKAGKSVLAMVLEQFKDRMVQVLLVAVALGFIFAYAETDPEEKTIAIIEPFVILTILALNAIVAVMQEIRAQKSVDSLKSYQPNIAFAWREGKLTEIRAEELVAGDIIQVNEGQQIPADVRVWELGSTQLLTDEGSLTGESVSAEKQPKKIEWNGRDPVAVSQKHSCAFGGTPITRGRFTGIVFAVGVSSEIGKIQHAVDEAEEVVTPLQQKLDTFGEVLSKGILVICIITWLANIPRFKELGKGSVLWGALNTFKVAVALAVAAIPEGLPAVVTTTLSLGVNRMAKQNAVVTKLPAVETLGCTSVICSDKTGTLTQNEMTVRAFLTVVDGKPCVFDVEAMGYSPSGWVKINGAQVSNMPSRYGAMKAAMVATHCNDATLLWDADKKKFMRNGEPTDAAFKVLAEKLGLPDRGLQAQSIRRPLTERFHAVADYWQETMPKVRVHEFTRDRKGSSAIIGAGGRQGYTLVVKGAFEVVLEKCTHYIDDISGEVLELTDAVRQAIDELRVEWAGGSNCYRCLGLAYKELEDGWEDWEVTNQARLHTEYERGLVWAGAGGIVDPARDTVPPAIQSCKTAGIRVIMCTGDAPATAAAIAKKIGMLGETEDVTGRVFTGSDWQSMSEERRAEAAANAVVMARVDPVHKQQLVRHLQAQGHVVAMTGDGVNDSPALAAADIGVAMGSGTQVAKDAAKMILQDDSFATIVRAVEEGRSIYNNTTSFIRYLITSNIGEVVSCFVSSILGGPPLLRSTQLLFVNLVTDGLPATALGVNPTEPGVMNLKPRSKSEGIVTKFALLQYIVGGLYLGFATIAAAYYWFMFDPSGPHITFKQIHQYLHAEGLNLHEVFDDSTPSTMAMSVLVLVEMCFALTAISERQSIFVVPPWKNIWLVAAVAGSVLVHVVTVEWSVTQRIFQVAHISARQWGVLLLFALPAILIEEVFKLYLRAQKE